MVISYQSLKKSRLPAIHKTEEKGKTENFETFECDEMRYAMSLLKR